MKSRIITAWLLVALIPMTASPTTIVVVARKGSIYVGADSMRGDAKTTSVSVCKLKQYSAILITHYGPTIVSFQADPAKPSTTVFDADDLMQKTASIAGSLSDKANWLEKSFWEFYRHLISTDLPSFKSAEMRKDFENNFRLNGFVIAGRGKSGMPEAIVLQFTIDFREFSPRPMKTRWTIPGDRTELYLGVSEIQPKPGRDPFAENIDKGITDYLAIESTLHPHQVGPPYAIARIGKSGITFDQNGACK